MAKYNVEFKNRVVKSYYASGLANTMRKFKIPARETIYNWVRKYETVGLMRKKSKLLSGSEKLDILKYYWKNGPGETHRKYQLQSGTLHVWDKIYEENGLEGLESDNRGKTRKKQIKYEMMTDKEKIAYLEMENEYLKKLDALVRSREEREHKKK